MRERAQRMETKTEPRKAIQGERNKERGASKCMCVREGESARAPTKTVPARFLSTFIPSPLVQNATSAFKSSTSSTACCVAERTGQGKACVSKARSSKQVQLAELRSRWVEPE
eukprot:497233-Rhodomonas_salina.3